MSDFQITNANPTQEEEEFQREEQVLETSEERDQQLEWGFGEVEQNEDSGPESFFNPQLSPLQQSLQRVYGNSFVGFSPRQLEGHLRLQAMPLDNLNMTDGDYSRERSFENTLVRENIDNIAPMGHFTSSSTQRVLSEPSNRTKTDCPANDTAKRKSRTHLNDTDRLTLMSLCVDHQAEHVPNKKTAFWLLMSELLEKENNVKLRDPQKTVSILVAKRKVEISIHSKESGTVQREDELSQKIDAWISHEEQLQHMVLQTAKTSSALEREAGEAAAHRRNMLVRFGEKRPWTEDLDEDIIEIEDSGDEGVDNQLREEVRSDSTIKREGKELQEQTAADRMRQFRKRKRLEREGRVQKVSVETQTLVTAVEGLGQGMLSAVRELVASRSVQNQLSNQELIDSRFQELRQDMERQKEIERAELERQRREDQAASEARNEDLLTRIFSKLEEFKKG